MKRYFTILIFILSMSFIFAGRDYKAYYDLYTMFMSIGDYDVYKSNYQRWTFERILSVTEGSMNRFDDLFKPDSYPPLYVSRDEAKKLKDFFEDKNDKIVQAVDWVCDLMSKYVEYDISRGHHTKKEVMGMVDRVLSELVGIDFNAETKNIGNEKYPMYTFVNDKYEKEWSILKKFFYRRGQVFTDSVRNYLARWKTRVMTKQIEKLEETGFYDFDTLCIFLTSKREIFNSMFSPFTFNNLVKNFFDVVYQVVDQPKNYPIYLVVNIWDSLVRKNIRSYFYKNPEKLKHATGLFYEALEKYILFNTKNDNEMQGKIIKTLDWFLETTNNIDYDAKLKNVGNSFDIYYEFENPEYVKWNKVKKFCFRNGKHLTEILRTKAKQLKTAIKKSN